MVVITYLSLPCAAVTGGCEGGADPAEGPQTHSRTPLGAGRPRPAQRGGRTAYSASERTESVTRDMRTLCLARPVPLPHRCMQHGPGAAGPAGHRGRPAASHRGGPSHPSRRSDCPFPHPPGAQPPETRPGRFSAKDPPQLAVLTPPRGGKGTLRPPACCPPGRSPSVTPARLHLAKPLTRWASPSRWPQRLPRPSGAPVTLGSRPTGPRVVTVEPGPWSCLPSSWARQSHPSGVFWELRLHLLQAPPVRRG